MMGWLIFAVWVAGILPIARWHFSYIRAKNRDGDSNFDWEWWNDNQMLYAAASLGIGLIWPISGVVFATLLSIMAKPKKSRTEYEEEAREREAHIRDLERELGIK